MAKKKRGRPLPGQMIGSEIVGLGETLNALRDLPPKLEARAVRDGVKAGADVVLREEKNTVPVGRDRPGRPSGTLRASLGISRLRKKRKTRTLAFVGAAAEGFYGRFLEYGTRFMPARPWLRPALHAAFSPSVAATRKAIASRVDRIVKDVARAAGSTSR